MFVGSEFDKKRGVTNIEKKMMINKLKMMATDEDIKFVDEKKAKD